MLAYLDYDASLHVPSDVGVDSKYLDPAYTKTQTYLDEIAQWTINNKMKVNESKCNYMLFSRSKEQMLTRLSLNNVTIDRIPVSKVLGIWISKDVGNWERNTTEICKKAYARISMLTKLKYVGVKTEDLLEIYVLFIRSVTEYCSTVFHSSLTKRGKNWKYSKTCLRVILQECYVDYFVALEMTGLQSLKSRRDSKSLSFAKKAQEHPTYSKLFPKNPTNGDHYTYKRQRTI